jgi:carboxymethylenebutenolidase
VKKTLLAVLIILAGVARAQEQKTCCAPVTHTASFAQLGSDKEFRMAHLEPMAFAYQSTSGRMVTFTTPDSATAQGFEVKATKGSGIVILMIHEWWGLNDYIKREADRLHVALGGKATVLALDLYDGKVASKREDAAKFMGEAKEDRIRSIISGAIAYAGKRATIGTIGWCFGGGWSFQAALMAADKAKACVMYYGMPETDPEKLAPLSAPVLGIFADKDAWITPEVVKKFSEAMKKAGKDLTLKTYNADHAFANPSNPQYDKVSTEDAYGHVISFFEAKLLK